MPKGLTPKQEKAWSKAKKVVKKQKGKKNLSKKDWPLVMHITKEIAKEASSVRVEPYESLVDKAVRMVEEQLGGGALSKVKTIVLEPNSSGHYGRVQSDKPDTIYLSFNRIRNELANMGEEAVVRQLAGTIAHELGHLESDFQGGEGPAEGKAHNFLAQLDAKESYLRLLRVDSIVRLAHQLDQDGFNHLADFCDISLDQIKLANLQGNPEKMISGLVELISYMVSRVKPENRKSYLESFSNKLRQLSGESLSGKNKNPGAGIGAISSLVKNMLAGQDPATVSTILRKVLSRVQSL